MGSLASELRYSLRRLRKAGWFSLTVVLMLACGIGAATTIFSLIEGILLRPLPFRDPDRLVQLGEHVGNNPGIGITARDIRVYSHAATAFSSMGGFAGAQYELSGGPSPENVAAARFTSGVFPTLGVQPPIGRVFTEQEEDLHARVALISYALWTNRYHRDPQVAGATIDLDRKPYTIIGVMPRSFEFPVQAGRINRAQLWVPMSLTPEELSDEAAGRWGYQMVARLKDGVTVNAAAQDASRVAQQIMRGFPASMSKIQIRGDARPLSEEVTGDTRPLLRVLLFAVLVVLLIVCANIAILMLLRAIRNHREHAVRLALGARPLTILREAMAEGWILSFVGGLLGLGFAAIAVRTALHLVPESMPRVDSIFIDLPVAFFTMAIVLVTGTVCSLVPAFVVSRTNLVSSLNEQRRTGTTGHVRLRSALVVAETGIALVLLTTSGAFLRSYQNMLAIDPGFRPEHVLVAGYQLPVTQYSSDAAVAGFNRAIIERLSSQVGVIAVGIGETLPSSENSAMSAYTVEGESADGWKLKFAGFAATEGKYFEALGIPLVAGRTFTENDRAGSPLVVIVSRSMAHHSWPGQNPLGKRMHVGNPKKNLPWATVVGVVGDTRIGARDQKGNDQWYLPAQQPAILYGSVSPGTRTIPAAGFITLRAALWPEQMSAVLHDTVAGVDPLLALQQVRPMSDVLSTTEAPRRIMTELIAAFAAIALALPLTGIYAVMSFSVTLRTHEIAIRMALGAQRDGIATLVLGSGAKLALAGCALGVAGSLAVSRLVRSFLFGVSATDAWIYAGSVLLMLGIAILASALPAFRAASADPIEALRSAQ